MAQSKAKWFAVGAALLLMFTAFPSAGSISYAQGSSRTFPETGHTVKGRFLDYWNTHGGLAQQGYPISEEFKEVSPLDGKTYTVQYFERAVFELHPENAPPYDVLLSQLGKFRYDAKYGGGGGGQPHPTPTTVSQRPPTPVPSCDQGVPVGRDGTVTPKCGKIGTVFQIEAHGFAPNE